MLESNSMVRKSHVAEKPRTEPRRQECRRGCGQEALETSYLFCLYVCSLSVLSSKLVLLTR